MIFVTRVGEGHRQGLVGEAENKRVHVFGVSVEILLKLVWLVLKQVLNIFKSCK